MIRRAFCFPLALVLVVLLLPACTAVGSGAGSAPRADRAPEPEVSYPNVSGDWRGFLSVEDQTLDGTLRIDQTASVLSMRFEAPEFGLTATGEGRVEADGAIVGDLSYETQCPGVARLRGQRASDGLAIEGSLEAEDCTGRITGSFAFRR